MPRGASVDGFRLAYDRAGSGPPVVALHGWPGSRRDYREVAARLAGEVDLVVPDLRGFGASGHDAAPDAYAAGGQAASVLGLIDELALERAVLVGYDVGSRVAQTVARERPDAVRALVISPPLSGVGDRILSADAQREFWYQPFHRLSLSTELIDGRREAVASYLRHFWEHWSGPGWSPPPDELDALVDDYARPGAFAASIGWYRAGAGTLAAALAERTPAPAERLAVPTTVLWPTEDPLFPVAWADRIDAFLARAQLRVLDGVGHFVPLQAPDEVAGAIRAATGTSA
ncbi:MAG: alpha/beta fold hydrolase [Solirubrobacteraceae bacterium]